MHRSIRRSGLAAALALAALPAAASAHVTLQPTEAPAGGFARLDVRVPNERDDAATRKVVVQFPEGFLSVSHEPVPGWTAEVKMAKLAEPVEEFGEKRTQRVDTLTFATRGNGIQPGQFQDFGISVRLPEKPGTALTFKALQTYAGGEVVRWIGEPDSEEPAPQVQLTDADGEQAATHEPAATPAAASSSGDGGSDTLAIVALVVGALGLAAGVAGLLLARRRTATA